MPKQHRQAPQRFEQIWPILVGRGWKIERGCGSFKQQHYVSQGKQSSTRTLPPQVVKGSIDNNRENARERDASNNVEFAISYIG